MFYLVASQKSSPKKKLRKDNKKLMTLIIMIHGTWVGTKLKEQEKEQHFSGYNMYSFYSGNIKVLNIQNQNYISKDVDTTLKLNINRNKLTLLYFKSTS